MIIVYIHIFCFIVLKKFILIIEIIDVIDVIVWCWQVRVDLGLPDHIWATKHAAIAKRVDDVGDQFSPAMRKGWLAYFEQTYAVDPDHYDGGIGQGDLVVPDDEWLLWGPEPPGLIFTLNTDANHSFMYPNNRNNCSNNDNNWQ